MLCPAAPVALINVSQHASEPRRASVKRRGRIGMHKAVSLFTLAAAIVVAAWWWLGAPVAMPPSPLDPGEKLYCVSYAPFRGSQTPLDLSTRIERWQIEEDLT